MITLILFAQIAVGAYFTPEASCRAGFHQTTWHNPAYTYYIECARNPQFPDIGRPDPKLTPGDVRTSDAVEICARGFRTKRFRQATKSRSALKRVCALYGFRKDCPKRGDMELDDLVPVELGGRNSEANLWVQMAPEFHWKDVLENRMRHLVCIEQTLNLASAQQQLITDWPAAYLKYVGPFPK